MKRNGQRKETLPVTYYENGKGWYISSYSNNTEYVTCTPYEQMSDGTMVWADSAGKQYFRRKIFGKYFFERL